jgi:hypothetical protein
MGMQKEVLLVEKDISAKEPQAQESSWLFEENEFQSRSQSY